ncbi:MAG: hypothetical protein AAGJ55_05380, partial [Cyanobacteria bacterium J06555_12]
IAVHPKLGQFLIDAYGWRTAWVATGNGSRKSSLSVASSDRFVVCLAVRFLGFGEREGALVT